jgi:hypothetical protein
VALDGLREAMRTGNEAMLCLFWHLSIFNGVSMDIVLWGVENAGHNLREVLDYIVGMYVLTFSGSLKEFEVDPWVDSTVSIVKEVEEIRTCKGNPAKAYRVLQAWLKTAENWKTRNLTYA